MQGKACCTLFWAPQTHWEGSRDNDQPYLNLSKSQNYCLFKKYPSSFSGNVDNHIDVPFSLCISYGVCHMLYWYTFFWYMSFVVCFMVYDVCLKYSCVLFLYILFHFCLDWISFTRCLFHLISFLYFYVLYIDSGKLDSVLTSLCCVSV